MKALVAVQSKHPYSFGDQTVLPAIVDFSLNKITNAEPTVSFFEQFLIQCMVLVKSVLECKEYRPSLTGRVINESEDSLSLEQRKKNISTAVADILKTILPSDHVILLCNILIRRYWDLWSLFLPISSLCSKWFTLSMFFFHHLLTDTYMMLFYISVILERMIFIFTLGNIRIYMHEFLLSI